MRQCVTCISINVMECFLERAKRNRDKRVIRICGYFLIPCFFPLRVALCFYLCSWYAWRTHVHAIWRTASYVKRRRDEKSSATGFRVGRPAGHKTWPRFKRIAFFLSLSFRVRVYSPFLFLLLSLLLPSLSRNCRSHRCVAFYASPNYGSWELLSRQTEKKKREREKGKRRKVRIYL